MAARIAPETRERVQRAAQELGYEPNYLARSLGRRRTDTVGLMISGLKNPFFVDIMETAERLAQEAGYQVLLDAAPSIAGTYAMHGKLRNWPVDGILMWAFAHQKLDDFVGSRAAGVPIVYLGYARDDGAATVSFDLYGGGRQAAEHLLQRGYRRIAFVTTRPFPVLETADARYRAYHDLCSKAGRTPEVFVLEPAEQTRAAGFQSGRALAALPASKRPDALLCINDVIAVGVYHGLQHSGLRVPEDVAVVGFDGIEEGRYLDVPLTTVDAPVEQLCRQAFDLLMRRLSGALRVTQQIVIPTTLRIGGTT